MLPLPKSEEWGADKLAYKHAEGEITQKQAHQVHKSLSRLKKVSEATMKACSPGHLPKCPQASLYTP